MNQKAEESPIAVDSQAAPVISYEQARAELDEVVARLEAGASSLVESVELWQRGEKLVEICQAWLDGAKAALETVTEGKAGEVPSPEG